LGVSLKYFKRAAYLAALFISVFTSAYGGCSKELQILSASGNIYGCSISADGDGNVLTAWTADTGSSVSAAFVKSSTNYGKDWQGTLCISGARGVSGAPKTACRNGVLHALWAEKDALGTLQAWYSRNTGSGWSTPARLSSNGCLAGQVLIAAGESGSIHAAWLSAAGACAVKSLNSGLQWSDPVILSANAASIESLAASGNCAYLCLLAGSPSSVYLTTCLTSWNSAVSRKVSENLSPEFASIPVFGAGFTAWRQSGGAGEDVLASSGGTPVKLSSATGAVAALLPYFAQDGAVNVFWQRNTGGASAFYSSTTGNGSFSQENKEFEISGLVSSAFCTEGGLVYLLLLRAGSISFQLFDNIPPSAPKITSATHAAPSNSSNNCPSFSAVSTDGQSAGAIAGYGFSLDNAPLSEAPLLINSVDGKANYPGLTPRSWYFHARAFDLVGNYGVTSHYKITIAGTQFLPSEEFFIFPNPVKSAFQSFRFFSSDAAAAKIDIYDDSGNLRLAVKRQAAQGVNIISDIDLSLLGNGVYLGRLSLTNPASGVTASAVKKILVLR